MRKLTLIVLLAALMLAIVVVPAFAIVDPITPADECRGRGGVGSEAIPALTGDADPITGFPVPNNNPGSADVSGSPNGVPASCE